MKRGQPRIPTPADIRAKRSSMRKRREILDQASSAPQLSALARDVIPFGKVLGSQFGPTRSVHQNDGTKSGTRTWLFTTETYARRFKQTFSRYVKP